MIRYDAPKHYVDPGFCLRSLHDIILNLTNLNHFKSHNFRKHNSLPKRLSNESRRWRCRPSRSCFPFQSEITPKKHVKTSKSARWTNVQHVRSRRTCPSTIRNSSPRPANAGIWRNDTGGGRWNRGSDLALGHNRRARSSWCHPVSGLRSFWLCVRPKRLLPRELHRSLLQIVTRERRI